MVTPPPPPVIFLLALLASATPSVVLAQEAAPSEMAAARDLFEQGVAAAREERWEEARDLFEQSHRIVPRASTLLNLASAQAETGQLLRAAESYRRFIAEAGGREAALVGSAEEALADVEARLARVTIEVEGLAAEDEVWLDEQVLGHASLGVPLPVDPGDHVVTVARNGAPAGEEHFTVEEGQSDEVSVTASEAGPRVVDARIAPAPAVDEDEGSSPWSSPWLWTGVGVAVVAAIVIPIVVVATATGSPHMGSLGVGSLTFQ